MKKRYETPVMESERFDVEDVITASSASSQIVPGGTIHNVSSNWEITPTAMDFN